jgi:hypothetical protein
MGQAIRQGFAPDWTVVRYATVERRLKLEAARALLPKAPLQFLANIREGEPRPSYAYYVDARIPFSHKASENLVDDHGWILSLALGGAATFSACQ